MFLYMETFIVFYCYCYEIIQEYPISPSLCESVKVTMFANVNIGKSVRGLNMRYVFMSHGGCLPPPTASPECFSWYFLKKKLVRKNWIVYLKSETSYKPINNVPICKEKNFPLKGKRFS